MANIIKETKRDLKFRISKKHSFSLSKRLLKSLTTNQLLLLLPTIIEKIIRNNNIHIVDEHSDQTDFSMPTSEDCFKSSKNSTKFQSKGVSLFTNSNSDKSQRNWFSLPMFSKDCKTLCSESLTFKNESVKTFESLFNDIAVTNRSKDSTIKRFKRYTQRLCNKYRKELSETTGNVQSVSDANTNCQKQSFLMDKTDCLDSLLPCDKEYESNDSSITKSKLSKLAIDINEISTIDFEEYFEIINSEEFSFIDICFEKSNEKLSQVAIISNIIYTGQLIKYSDHHINPISTIIDGYNNQFKLSVENSLTSSMTSVFKNLFEHKSNQLDSSNSLEVRVDVCEDQSINFDQTTSAKSMESIDTIINNYVNVLSDDDFKFGNSSINEFNSICVIKENYQIKDSINKSSTLSLSNCGFEINQMGDTNHCETEEIDSVKSIKNKMKAKQNCGILFSPKYAEVEINKIFSSIVEQFNDDLKFKKSSFSNNKLQKRISIDACSNGSQLYNYTLQHLLTPDNLKNHSGKNYKNNIVNFGLSTSKIVNGRFQHGWHCTYKNCMIFNSLQRQTCKNCLNPRWCHPPLCRRDMICIDCGFINYKARLYCKKCKFMFIKPK